jgi:hypothetical protein
MNEFTTIANAQKQTGLSYIGGVATSSKISHSKTYSHQHTYGVYLAPASLSGYNVCSHATKECKAGCLNTSGRAGIEEFSGLTKIHDCRVKKTKLFYEQPEFFMAWMIAEIKMYKKRAEKKGFYFSVRLNCTSDIDWQNVTVNGQNIFEIFPDVAFYDYTKNINKFIDKPVNYHLTYSYTGRNELQCEAVLKAGFNIAVVFNVKHEVELPKYFDNYPVINGDLTDYRIDDAKGIIVGLKWKRIANRKAEAMILKSCFVVNPDNKRCTVECTTSNVQNIKEAVLVY